jgi:hypothetical protein
MKRGKLTGPIAIPLLPLLVTLIKCNEAGKICTMWVRSNNVPDQLLLVRCIHLSVLQFYQWQISNCFRGNCKNAPITFTMSVCLCIFLHVPTRELLNKCSSELTLESITKSCWNIPILESDNSEALYQKTYMYTKVALKQHEETASQKGARHPAHMNWSQKTMMSLIPFARSCCDGPDRFLQLLMLIIREQL